MCVVDPYFATLHDQDDEPTAEVLNDPHQGANHSISEWKSRLYIKQLSTIFLRILYLLDIIWQMIQEFKPPSWIADDSSEDE